MNMNDQWIFVDVFQDDNKKKLTTTVFFFQDLQSRADAQVSLLKENLASQSYLIKIGHQTS